MNIHNRHIKLLHLKNNHNKCLVSFATSQEVILVVGGPRIVMEKTEVIWGLRQMYLNFHFIHGYRKLNRRYAI